MSQKNYFTNIKPLIHKNHTAFALMGLTSLFLFSQSISQPPKELSDVVQASELIELAEPSKLITDSNKEALHKVGNFHLPEDIKPNNISKYITKVQLEKKEYFLALASQAEGYRGNIYKDNQGWALGNGWNLTKQSPEYNRQLAKAVFRDKKTVHTLTHMSGKSDEPITLEQMQDVQLPPQKALQITYLIGEKIRKEYVIPGISKVIQEKQKIEKDVADPIAHKVFKNLKKNEQDALIYHAYKCGGYSFLKFYKLTSKIIDYSLKKKSVSKESIVAEFDYSYTLKGKKYFDKQAQELVGAMFLGPHYFAQVTNIKLPNFDEPIPIGYTTKVHKKDNVKIAKLVKGNKDKRTIVASKSKKATFKVASNTPKKKNT